VIFSSYLPPDNIKIKTKTAAEKTETKIFSLMYLFRTKHIWKAFLLRRGLQKTVLHIAPTGSESL